MAAGSDVLPLRGNGLTCSCEVHPSARISTPPFVCMTSSPTRFDTPRPRGASIPGIFRGARYGALPKATIRGGFASFSSSPICLGARTCPRRHQWILMSLLGNDGALDAVDKKETAIK